MNTIPGPRVCIVTDEGEKVCGTPIAAEPPPPNPPPTPLATAPQPTHIASADAPPLKGED